MLLEVGRICVKKYGRDAGSRAVITSVGKDGTVMIMTAIRPKERKCNTAHLEFLNEVIDMKNKEHVMKTLGVQEKKERHDPAKDAKKTKA
jgi:ribosomal protein L14E/L6E/L27E